MLLEAYVRATLLVTAASERLSRRAAERRGQDNGLATLEWVALAIVAVTLAAGAAVGIRAVINRKISEIP